MTGTGKLRLVIAVFLGASAVVCILFGTTSAVGTLNDSAYYFSAAESLASGQGIKAEITHLDHPAWIDDFAAWPPLYPMLLSLGLVAGLSIESAARVVGLGAVMAIAISLFSLAYLLSRQWIVAALATFLALTVRPVWETLHYALSEPLFMALSFATLAVFAAGVFNDQHRPEKQTLISAVVVTVLLSLTILTRYLGAAYFVALALLLLYLLTRQAEWRRWRPEYLILLSPVPLLFYLFRNWCLTGTLTDARRTGYPSSLDAFAREVLTGWQPASPFPLGLTAIEDLGVALGIASVTVLVFALVVVSRLRNAQSTEPTSSVSTPRQAMPAMAIVGVALTIYLVVVAALSARGSVWPNDIGRLLVPIWPLAIILVVGSLFIVAQNSRLLRVGVLAAAVLLLIQLVDAARFSRAAHGGLGFGADPWQTNQALELAENYVSELQPPDQVAIFSNFAPAVWLRIRAPVKRLDGTLNGHQICASFNTLPPGTSDFMLVLFSQVTPDIVDPFWQEAFAQQLGGCVNGSPKIIPVADGLIVSGRPK